MLSDHTGLRAKRRRLLMMVGQVAVLAAAGLAGFGLGRLQHGSEDRRADVRPQTPAGLDRLGGPLPGAAGSAAGQRAAGLAPPASRMASAAAAAAAAGDMKGALRSLIGIEDPAERRVAVDDLLRRLSPEEIHRLFREYDTMQGAGDFAQHPNLGRAAASTWELIVASLVADGPEEFLQSRLEQAGGESSSEEFESILGAWARRDLNAALAYFDAGIRHLQPAEFQGAAASLANNFFRLDPDRAAAWLASLPEATRAFCGPYALRSLAQEDPATAARLLATHDSLPERDELSRHAAQRWAMKDPQAAFAWASGLPSDLAAPALRGVMAQWMDGDFQTAARHADQLDPELRRAALPALADKAPDDMLPTLARQLAGEPGDEHLATAAARLSQRWAESDPTAASEWLVGQPDGPVRDSAIRGFTERLVEEDPDSAFEWTAVISDEETRFTALRQGIDWWINKDPEAARQWVQSSGTLSASDRERLLRRTGR